MQGKVMSEHSASNEVGVGIDVCKEWLDVHILPAGTVLRFSNTKKGHKQLLSALKPLGVRIVVVEATGKYHRGVHRFLHDAGLAVAVVNPLRARLFAELLGALAKTGSVDARMLATFGLMAQLAATPPLPEAIENLREIVRNREAALAAATALGNQLATAAVAGVKRQIERQIKSAKTAADVLEELAVQAIEGDPALARRFAILVSIPGVGAVTACGLIANMPELGSLSAKQACSQGSPPSPATAVNVTARAASGAAAKPCAMVSIWQPFRRRASTSISSASTSASWLLERSRNSP